MNEEYLKMGCPELKPIECLNLIMRREFAEQILKGEKSAELRAVSEHYFSRLTDAEVNDWASEHADEVSKGKTYLETVRPVKKIHFHNYANSWHLDVECKMNTMLFVTKDQIQWLNEDYNCHELDKMCETLDKKGEQNRPAFYIFVLGEILDTNLK